MSDELIGSIKFSIEDLLKATKEKPVCKWINVYGAHMNYSGDNTDKMNNDPDQASAWKGRILVMYYQEHVKNPVMKVRNMNEQEIKQLQDQYNTFAQYDYSIIAEVGAGICMPSEKKYQVRIQINEYTVTTDDLK